MTALISVNPLQLPEWAASGDIVRIAGDVYEVLFVDAVEGLLEMTSDGVPDDLTGPIRIIRQSVLLDSASPTPVMVADIPGLYRFRLVVNDGESDSEPSEVLANVTALQTPSGVEPDVSLIWKAIGDEWRYIEGRDVFEEAWIGVAQVLSGKMLESWQHHYNTSIRDAQQVFQRKWVAFRTLLPETAPEEASISPRLGGFVAAKPFENGRADVAGEALNIEVLLPDGTVRTIVVHFWGES